MIIEIHALHIIKLLEDDPYLIYNEVKKIKDKDAELAKEVLDYHGDKINNYSTLILSLCYIVGKRVNNDNIFGNKVEYFDQKKAIKLVELMFEIGFDYYIKNGDNNTIYDFLSDQNSPLYKYRSNNELFINYLHKKLEFNYDYNEEDFDDMLLKLKNDYQKLNIV